MGTERADRRARGPADQPVDRGADRPRGGGIPNWAAALVVCLFLALGGWFIWSYLTAPTPRAASGMADPFGGDRSIGGGLLRPARAAPPQGVQVLPGKTVLVRDTPVLITLTPGADGTFTARVSATGPEAPSNSQNQQFNRLRSILGRRQLPAGVELTPEALQQITEARTKLTPLDRLLSDAESAELSGIAAKLTDAPPDADLARERSRAESIAADLKPRLQEQMALQSAFVELVRQSVTAEQFEALAARPRPPAR